MEYTGKDGKEHYISVDSLYWIKGHADLLDEDVNKFLWTAVDEASTNFDIKPAHIFRFLIEHENFPELEKVLQIADGSIRLPLKDIMEYVDQEGVESIIGTRDSNVHMERFCNMFKGFWDTFLTPDRRSFNSPYDGLIIAHRISGLDMDTVLTWFFIMAYSWTDITYSSVDDIVKYCHKYADDPKLFKEI